MARLKVRITPQGQVEVVPEGFRGEGCLKATKPFEGLGKLVKEQDLPERFESNAEHEGHKECS